MSPVLNFILCKAAKEGDIEKIRYLIEKKGVSVSEANFNGRSSLHLAVMNRHQEVAKLLIGVFLSEKPNAEKPEYIIEGELSSFWEACKSEIEVLCKLTFSNESFLNLSLWDLYQEKDEEKMALISKHPGVREMFSNPDFIKNYPCFGNKIQINFEKGEKVAGVTQAEPVNKIV